jgi:type VI secretion system secreted protein VgrG
MRFRATIAHEGIPADAHVVSLRVREGLSELFEVGVEFLVPDPDLDLEALLDKPCHVTFEETDSGEGPRIFHGMVEECEALESSDLASRYTLRLRPRVAALAHRVRSRIFQQSDAVAIVKEVLRGAGVPDDAVSFRLSRSYPKRELSIAYRESELDFVLRLLEEEGIFYWFEHEESGHVMAFGDDPSASSPLDGESTLAFTNGLEERRESVTELVFSSRLGPDAHVTRDWNFERPSEPIEAEAQRESGGSFVTYEYPGRFLDRSSGSRLARDRLDAADRTRELAGRSNCRRLAPGRLFEIEAAQPDYLNRDWLLVSVDHAFEAAASPGALDQRYTARFRARPGDAPFRPLRVTPRPRILGRELAQVTGPSGEEIHVDTLGRVKVHFYWDREGKHDDTSSTWLRVQQLNTSGAMTLPRVGWEVSVAFLGGDPDRPVVLHKLPNRDGMPSHDLPGGKTKMALQSATSPAGPGVNALSMEDGSGGMELALVASRDLNVVVGSDHAVTVGTDESEEVGQSLQTLVGGKEKVTIGGDQTVSVGGNMSLETVGNKTVTIAGSDAVKVKGNHALTCDGSRKEKVGGIATILLNKLVLKVNGESSREIGAALCLNGVKALVEQVGGAKSETVGAARVELLTGTDIGLAAKAITVTVGGPMAVKATEGFTLSGKTVKITVAKAQIEAAGSKLEAAGSLKVTASSMAGSGKASLKLKGKIDYSD